MTNAPSARAAAWVETTSEHGRVRLTGELDMASCATIEGELVAHLRPAATLMIDCRELTFCDSSGLATLIAVRARAATASGTVQLYNVAPNVMRVLEATALVEAFGAERCRAARTTRTFTVADRWADSGRRQRGTT